MKKIYIIFIAFLVGHFLLLAEGYLQPLNLDFEIGTVGQPPFGWTLTGNSIELGYYCTTTNEKPYTGRYCIEFGKTEETEIDNWGAVFQKIDVQNLVGRRFVFSVFARAEIKEKSSFGSIWVSVFTRDNKQIYSAKSENTPIRDGNWQRYVVEGRLEDDAYTMNIGFMFNGIGKLWFDNVQIAFLDESNLEFQPAHSLDKQAVKNISKFLELYGYVRYFHPSSESQGVDWNQFLVDGIMAVEQCKSDIDLYDTLYSRFIPVAPALKFSNKLKFDERINYSLNPLSNVLLSYLHKGACTNYEHTLFSSKIVNTKLPQRTSEALVKQIINTKDIQKRKITISAFARLETQDEISNIQLWVRLEDENNNFLKLITTENQQVKSPKWEEIRISFTLPEQVSYMWLGLVLAGEGTAYFDNVQLLAEKREKGKVVFDTVALMNADFELGHRADVLLGWTLDKESSKAGYRALISEEKPAKGKKCLKLFSDERTKITVPRSNDFYSVKINEDLLVQVPVVLPVDSFGTIPRYAEGAKQWGSKTSLSENNFYHRIAIIGYLWNFFKHFALTISKDEDWESVLISCLERVQNVSAEAEFLDLLNFLCYKSNDPNAKAWKGDLPSYFSYPFNWKKIEDFVFITKSHSSNKMLLPGDIVLEINSVRIDEIIAEKSKEMCIKNDELRATRALAKIKSAEKSTVDTFLVQKPTGRTYQYPVARNIYLDELETKPYPAVFKFEGSNNIYVDLTRANEYDIKKYLQQLAQADGIVFDLRGEAQVSEHFLGFLIDKPIQFVDWILPIFAFPNRENQSRQIISSVINPKTPRFSAKVIFLCDETTSGYAEAILMIAKYYDLGKIVGRETAGIPYEAYSFNIPGNFSVSFSGLYCLDINGENIPIGGVKPTIKIKYYADQYIKYDDYLLEKAIEELNK